MIRPIAAAKTERHSKAFTESKNVNRLERGRELVGRGLVGPPVVSLLDVAGQLFCFGPLVILDVVRGY